MKNAQSSSVTSRRRAARWLALVTLVLAACVAGLAYSGRLDLHAVGRTFSDVRETSLDAALEAKVRSALALSRRVAGLDLRLAVQRGQVTLDGVVPSSEASAIAEAIVADTPGVERVANRLRIDPEVAATGYERTLLQRIADLETRVAIQEHLDAEPLLEGGHIDVRIEEGEIVLEGQVANEMQRATALHIAESLAGPTEVRSLLASQAGDEEDGDRLARRVEFELYDSGAFTLDDVRISNDGGDVWIAGTVRSEAERLLAGILATHVPGVTRVYNELGIRTSLEGEPFHEPM